jgi:hypothetical protein
MAIYSSLCILADSMSNNNFTTLAYIHIVSFDRVAVLNSLDLTIYYRHLREEVYTIYEILIQTIVWFLMSGSFPFFIKRCDDAPTRSHRKIGED